MNRFRIPELKEVDSDKEQEKSYQLIGLRLGSEEYVVDINSIREIVMLEKITYVPRVADHFEGVVNLRGEVLPVINLRLKLGMPDVDFTPFTRIIVAQFSDASVGFLVDAITRVFRIPETNMDPATSSVGDVSAEYLRGVGRTESNIVGWLDLEKLAA